VGHLHVGTDGDARVDQVYATELDALRRQRQRRSEAQVRFLPYGIAVSVLDDPDLESLPISIPNSRTSAVSTLDDVAVADFGDLRRAEWYDDLVVEAGGVDGSVVSRTCSSRTR